MRNNETGRSMVEMLGVLAIIGVLSVAGIAGYTMAMRKVKVNDILAYASQCGILARAYNAGEGASTNTECSAMGADSLTDAGLNSYLSSVKGLALTDGSEVTLSFSAGNKAICDEVKTISGSTSGTCADAACSIGITFED